MFQAFLIIFLVTIRLQFLGREGEDGGGGNGWGGGVGDPSVGSADSSPYAGEPRTMAFSAQGSQCYAAESSGAFASPV